MQVHFGVELLRAEWRQSIVCIGTFDGVHLGHQQVIRTAQQLAAERELPIILVTFDRHPAVVLQPSKAPAPIAAMDQNLANIERLGVALTVVLPFNAWLSRMSADEFLESVLREKLHAVALVVGHDFALGNGREGTTDWLNERIETFVVPAYEIAGTRVSSSEIRRAISAGEVEVATCLLGRPFELEGFVVTGQKLGRTLGFPTANIARSFGQILPPNGVYAARLSCSHGTFDAALAIGVRPTVDNGPRSIEAYLLDFPGALSLYGDAVRVAIHHRLRDEAKFASLELMVEQMHRDVAEVRALLAHKKT